MLTLSNFRSAEYQFCFLSPLSFGWEEYLEWARIEPWSSCLVSNRSNHKTKAAVNDGQQLVERSSDSRVRILPPKLLFLLLLYFCSSRELTNVVFLRKAFWLFRSVCFANKEIQWKKEHWLGSLCVVSVTRFSSCSFYSMFCQLGIRFDVSESQYLLERSCLPKHNQVLSQCRWGPWNTLLSKVSTSLASYHQVGLVSKLSICRNFVKYF